MHTNILLFKALLSLLLGAIVTTNAQDQPAFTEVISPHTQSGDGFGWHHGSLPDLTRDGVDEFYVVGTRRVYVYNGKTLKLLYWIGDPNVRGNFGHTTHSAGDLTGDGIPELLVGKPYGAGIDEVGVHRGEGEVGVVDGATGAELFTLNSPNPVTAGFFGHSTMRLLSDMTGDGKEDWLIHQPEPQSQTGRVYIFDSQTRKVVRTIRNTGAGYSFWMYDVEVIPDVDGDGKPDLVISSHPTSVRRDGQTISSAGRAIVRSLQTGAVLYELHDPEPQTGGGFGLVLTGIGDITNDKIGDIAVGTHFKDGNTGVIYLFSGADGGWLRTLRSPDPQPAGKFGRRIEVLPDLNDDGVPELFTQEDEFNLTYVYDGATSVLLKTIEYPGPLGPFFLIGTIRQKAAPGISAYLFVSPFAGDDNSGRVYYLPFTDIPKSTRLRAVGRTANGFRLDVTGEPGRKLEIQATSDFKTWEPVTSVTLGNTALEVEDSAAVSTAKSFYRAVQTQ